MRRFCERLISNWFPFFLLFLMILTWVLVLPGLGFYLDDWANIAAYDQAGIKGLMDYALDDGRPFMTYILIGTFKIAGASVLNWQIFSLFWRFVAGWMSWLLLRRIWPKRSELAAVSAVILMLFPFFKHQAFAITYNMIWMQSAMILASFLFTVIALQTNRRLIRFLFSAVALVLSAFQLIVTEYYLSVEIARIMLIWLVLRKQTHSMRIWDWDVIRKTFLRYLPYLAILILYFVYRFGILPFLIHDRNEIEITQSRNIFQLALYFVQMFVQYLSETFLGVWYRSINPAEFNLARPYTLLAAGIGIFTFGIIFALLRCLRKNDEFFRGDADSAEVVALGFIAAVLGFLPGIMIDKSPSTPFIYHDRFLIPSFWGIAVLTVGLAADALRGKMRQILFFSLLCATCVFFQINNSIAYRASWETQQRFQWQLKWRVPDLKENTAVIGDEIIASFTGGWADAAMVMEMYGKKNGINPAPYWYFSLQDDDYLTLLSQNAELYAKTKMFLYASPARDAVIITKPEYDRCLWLLDDLDAWNPFISREMKRIAGYQNKSRILYDSDYQMPTEVFGTDFPHTWCYYYQKAALAVDLGRYTEALALYDEADRKGFRFMKAVEMTPFIRAAAYRSDWQLAYELTQKAMNDPKITYEYFGKLWEEIAAKNEADSTERTAVLTQIQTLLEKR